MRVLLSLVVVSHVAMTAAFGWDDLGHQSVGKIAERNLNEKGKALVYEILGAEPLAVAATFPDHVRSDKRFSDKTGENGFDFAPYHFLEIPFGKTFKQLKDEDRVQKDAHVIIKDGSDMLEGLAGATSREQRMLVLRYIVHVVGDVHQPLHIGNGTDMGANLCLVQWTPPPKKDFKTGKMVKQHPWHDMKLHSVWDGKIAEYMKPQPPKGWFGYVEVANLIEPDIKKLSAAQKQAIMKADAAVWYDESQSLHLSVYPPNVGDKQPKEQPKERTYCRFVDAQGKPPSHDDAKVPVPQQPILDEAYNAKAAAIVKDRMMKGGLRLAQLINDIAVAVEPNAPANATVELVKSLRLINGKGHGNEQGHPQQHND